MMLILFFFFQDAAKLAARWRAPAARSRSSTNSCCTCWNARGTRRVYAALTAARHSPTSATLGTISCFVGMISSGKSFKYSYKLTFI